MAETERILIAGAGPVGLVAGLALAHQGIPVTVFEKEPALAEDLRAGSYHPPTLEMLEPYGITARMLGDGIIVPSWQIRDRVEGVLVEFDLGLLRDDTPYPYRLHLEQHKLTPMVLDAASRLAPFEIQFSTAVVAARQDGDGVAVTVEGPAGRRRERASYLIGADGHHSVVRAAMGAAFEGFTWPEMFLILSTPFDFGPLGYTCATYIADPDEWVMMFKVPGTMGTPWGTPLWRLAFPADPALPDREIMSDAAVQARIAGFLPAETPYEVVHRNAYRVHQRVAEFYQAGRMIIAGDAAHVNNPLGAMGLNGGVHDAINLAEKLGLLWRGEAGPEILGTYERQRRQAQIDFVQNITIRNKRLVEERDPVVRRQRQDELRALAGDREAHYRYVLDTSMISMVRKAATIE